jgi:hypothetical protein
VTASASIFAGSYFLFLGLGGCALLGFVVVLAAIVRHRQKRAATTEANQPPMGDVPEHLANDFCMDTSMFDLYSSVTGADNGAYVDLSVLTGLSSAGVTQTGAYYSLGTNTDIDPSSPYYTCGANNEASTTADISEQPYMAWSPETPDENPYRERSDVDGKYEIVEASYSFEGECAHTTNVSAEQQLPTQSIDNQAAEEAYAIPSAFSGATQTGAYCSLVISTDTDLSAPCYTNGTNNEASTTDMAAERQLYMALSPETLEENPYGHLKVVETIQSLTCTASSPPAAVVLSNPHLYESTDLEDDDEYGFGDLTTHTATPPTLSIDRDEAVAGFGFYTA